MIEITIKDVDLTEDITPEVESKIINKDMEARYKKVYDHLSAVVDLIKESESVAECSALLNASMFMLFPLDPDNKDNRDLIRYIVKELLKISLSEDNKYGKSK